MGEARPDELAEVCGLGFNDGVLVWDSFTLASLLSAAILLGGALLRVRIGVLGFEAVLRGVGSLSTIT